MRRPARALPASACGPRTGSGARGGPVARRTLVAAVQTRVPGHGDVARRMSAVRPSPCSLPSDESDPASRRGRRTRPSARRRAMRGPGGSTRAASPVAPARPAARYPPPGTSPRRSGPPAVPCGPALRSERLRRCSTHGARARPADCSAVRRRARRGRARARRVGVPYPPAAGTAPATGAPVHRCSCRRLPQCPSPPDVRPQGANAGALGDVPGARTCRRCAAGSLLPTSTGPVRPGRREPTAPRHRPRSGRGRTPRRQRTRRKPSERRAGASRGGGQGREREASSARRLPPPPATRSRAPTGERQLEPVEPLEREPLGARRAPRLVRVRFAPEHREERRRPRAR